nr:MAG TPA: hypothetical protein [Caudoviricetes sp.]
MRKIIQKKRLVPKQKIDIKHEFLVEQRENRKEKDDILESTRNEMVNKMKKELIPNNIRERIISDFYEKKLEGGL